MVPVRARGFAETLLDAGGETGRLIAGRDWSGTPLGPLHAWGSSLTTALSLVLLSPVPMVMLWGEHGVMLYNDAYSVFAGGRHPELLGSKVREGWPEVADFNDNVMRVGLAGGTLAYRHQEMTLHRHGRPEQVFMDLDYSPVLDESGRPAGVFAVVIETTERVAAERRRQEAEAALRAERDRAQGVLDNMGEAFALLDRDLRFVDLNAEAMRLEQRPRSAILGKTHWEAHPGAASELGELYRDAMRRRAPAGLEHRYVWPDGRDTWIDMRAYPVGDGLAVFYRDVTDRKRADEALRASELRLRTMLEIATVGIISFDMAGGVVEANDAFLRMVGHTREELEAGAVRYENLTPPDWRWRDEQTLAELQTRGQSVPFEKEYLRSDGSRFWIHCASKMLDERTAVEFIIDVTERKQAEAALADQAVREAAEAARREADALYRAYFENTPEALFVIGVTPDDDFVVEQVNPAHEAGVGFRNEDICGKRLADILPPELAERVLDPYRRVLETGELHQYREVYELPEPQHWDTSLVPVRDDQGRITRLIGSSRNVTRQVMAEEALRQAQKMDAVGQLTGGIAHDFNNLLAAVVGSFDLIRRKPEDVAKVKRFAEAGLQAAERGAKLTGQLLAFSRAQSIELKPVIVSDLVAGMEDLLARSLGPAVRLSLDLGGEDAVLSDPTQLEMSVLNLAINARDAMPEGGSLTISTAALRVDDDPELAPGDYVELSVTDTGSGMPPDVAARAFDPFFTTKGVGKGTGLGLSQVYGIARQAGGAVRIDSRPGEGTTVRILLPTTHAATRTHADEPAEEAAAAGDSALILVVDDDADIRRVLVDSLDALGYRVLEAQDGPAGLHALDAAPDLMILDFAMPGMNGAEVARAARERRPDLPIVFASGYADTAAIDAAIGDGGVVLRKPFRIHDLQAVVAEALSREL